MSAINTVINGNATQDPAVFRFDDGGIKASFSVAVNDSYFDPNKKEFKNRKTEYIKVQVRKRSLAENVLKSVKKGIPLLVSGRLATHDWEDREGNHRTEIVLHAENVGIELSYGIADFQKVGKNWVSENDEVETYDSALTGTKYENGEINSNRSNGSSEPEFADSKLEDMENLKVGAPF